MPLFVVIPHATIKIFDPIKDALQAKWVGCPFLRGGTPRGSNTHAQVRMVGPQMGWFQVTCPNCSAPLQTRLPEGITTVQCSQCQTAFGVQIQQCAMPPQEEAPKPSRRSGKRHDGSAPSDTLRAYHDFMKVQMRRLYQEAPHLSKQQVMKQAAALWADSDMNPKNAPAVQEEEVMDVDPEAGKRPADPKGTPNKGGARKRGKRRDDAGTSADAGPPSRAGLSFDDEHVVGGSGDDEQQNITTSVATTGNDVPMSWAAAARRAIGR